MTNRQFYDLGLRAPTRGAATRAGAPARCTRRPGSSSSAGRGDGTTGHRETAVNRRGFAAGNRPPPLHEHGVARGSPNLSDRSSRNVNAQRSGAGWAEARDKFPGRVDRASAGRGDGTVGHRDTVVNRRAASPDPRPQARVSALSPTPFRRTRAGIFVAARSPAPRPPPRVSAISRTPRATGRGRYCRGAGAFCRGARALRVRAFLEELSVTRVGALSGGP
jgi:hypothetical protein